MEIEFKYCPCCKENLLLSNFNNNKSQKDGKSVYCRKCSVEERKESRRRKREGLSSKSEIKKEKIKGLDRKQLKKNSTLKYNYGITLEDYNILLKNQESKCLICKDVYNNLVVDHDHKTGEVRGLLCYACNSGIGLLKENKNILLSAIEHLNK